MKMMKEAVLTLLMLGAGSSLSAAAQAFEGVIQFQAGGKGRDWRVTCSFKGGKVLVEREASNPYIIDSDAGLLISLIPKRGIYAAEKLEARQADPEVSAASVEDTGTSAEILGYSCKKFVLRGAKGSSEVWATQALGSFPASFSDLAGIGASSDSLEGRVLAMGYFPLRVIRSRDGGGPVLSEATLIEKKSLDSSLFSAPSSYRKIESASFKPSALPRP